MRIFKSVLFFASLLFAAAALAGRCGEIHSWTGCYLQNNAPGCDNKVVKMTFTNTAGKTMTQWIGETDIRDQPELKAHVSEMMVNYLTVNAYLDTHCSDGPCLTGHDYLCED